MRKWRPFQGNEIDVVWIFQWIKSICSNFQKKKVPFNSCIDSSSWTISIFPFIHFGWLFPHHICWYIRSLTLPVFDIQYFWVIIIHRYMIVSWIEYFFHIVRSVSFRFNKPMTEWNQGNIFELMMLIVCTWWRKNNLISKVLENRKKREFFTESESNPFGPVIEEAIIMQRW